MLESERKPTVRTYSDPQTIAETTSNPTNVTRKGKTVNFKTVAQAVQRGATVGRALQRQESGKNGTNYGP